LPLPRDAKERCDNISSSRGVLPLMLTELPNWESLRCSLMVPWRLSSIYISFCSRPSI